MLDTGLWILDKEDFFYFSLSSIEFPVTKIAKPRRFEAELRYYSGNQKNAAK